MEHAWIVTGDDEVELALGHEDLLVRPPDQQVPHEMNGTALGAVYARLARMNDGPRHASLRTRIEARLAQWDLPLTRRLAYEAALQREPADAVAYVLCAMLGFGEPASAMPFVHPFAGAVAGGASSVAIERGVPAAERLLALLDGRSDSDESANTLGLLFQGSATSRLIEARRRGTPSPPVPVTRRWTAGEVAFGDTTLQRGDALVVMLTSPRFHFGAGRHRCPGERIAEAIAGGVLAAIREGEGRADAPVARDPQP